MSTHQLAFHSAPAAERLSMMEIKARYPNQWVVLVDVDWYSDSSPDFRTAVVIAAGNDGREVLLRPEADEAMGRYKRIAHLHTRHFATVTERAACR